MSEPYYALFLHGLGRLSIEYFISDLGEDDCYDDMKYHHVFNVFTSQLCCFAPPYFLLSSEVGPVMSRELDLCVLIKSRDMKKLIK